MPGFVFSYVQNTGGQRNGAHSGIKKWAHRGWERGFAALTIFRKCEGHSCPSRYRIEGKFKLGPWVTNQRYYKDNLSAKRKRRLDRIDFVWNGRDYLCDRGFTAPLKFKRREGHCRVPIRHREGNLRLGSWVSVQRSKKNQMSAKRKARLKKIGFVWKPPRGGLARAGIESGLA